MSSQRKDETLGGQILFYLIEDEVASLKKKPVAAKLTITPSLSSSSQPQHQQQQIPLSQQSIQQLLSNNQSSQQPSQNPSQQLVSEKSAVIHQAQSNKSFFEDQSQYSSKCVVQGFSNSAAILPRQSDEFTGGNGTNNGGVESNIAQIPVQVSQQVPLKSEDSMEKPLNVINLDTIRYSLQLTGFKYKDANFFCEILKQNYFHRSNEVLSAIPVVPTTITNQNGSSSEQLQQQSLAAAVTTPTTTTPPPVLTSQTSQGSTTSTASNNSSSQQTTNNKFKISRAYIRTSQLYKSVIEFAIFNKYIRSKEKSRTKLLQNFDMCTQILQKKYPLIILLGGTSGTGKSTLSSILASRFQIPTVLSTDSIRHIIRNFMDESDSPILFTSTYEAGKFVPLDSNPLSQHAMSETKRTIQGYKIQCQLVQQQLEHVIGEYANRGEPMIIEGVHLTPAFMFSMMKKHPYIIPFTICIEKESKHRQRFAVRSKYMTLDKKKNKYIQYIANIRMIQSWHMEKSDMFLIPKINNVNIDKSVNIIHRVVTTYMRKMIKDQMQIIPERNINALKLYESFNKVIKPIINKVAISQLAGQDALLVQYFDNNIAEESTNNTVTNEQHNYNKQDLSNQMHMLALSPSPNPSFIVKTDSNGLSVSGGGAMSATLAGLSKEASSNTNEPKLSKAHSKAASSIKSAHKTPQSVRQRVDSQSQQFSIQQQSSLNSAKRVGLPSNQQSTPVTVTGTPAFNSNNNNNNNSGITGGLPLTELDLNDAESSSGSSIKHENGIQQQQQQLTSLISNQLFVPLDNFCKIKSKDKSNPLVGELQQEILGESVQEISRQQSSSIEKSEEVLVKSEKDHSPKKKNNSNYLPADDSTHKIVGQMTTTTMKSEENITKPVPMEVQCAQIAQVVITSFPNSPCVSPPLLVDASTATDASGVDNKHQFMRSNSSATTQQTVVATIIAQSSLVVPLSSSIGATSNQIGVNSESQIITLVVTPPTPQPISMQLSNQSVNDSSGQVVEGNDGSLTAPLHVISDRKRIKRWNKKKKQQKTDEQSNQVTIHSSNIDEHANMEQHSEADSLRISGHNYQFEVLSEGKEEQIDDDDVDHLEERSNSIDDEEEEDDFQGNLDNQSDESSDQDDENKDDDDDEEEEDDDEEEDDEDEDDGEYQEEEEDGQYFGRSEDDIQEEEEDEDDPLEELSQIKENIHNRIHIRESIRKQEEHELEGNQSCRKQQHHNMQQQEESLKEVVVVDACDEGSGVHSDKIRKSVKIILAEDRKSEQVLGVVVEQGSSAEEMAGGDGTIPAVVHFTAAPAAAVDSGIAIASLSASTFKSDVQMNEISQTQTSFGNFDEHLSQQQHQFGKKGQRKQKLYQSKSQSFRNVYPESQKSPSESLSKRKPQLAAGESHKIMSGSMVLGNSTHLKKVNRTASLFKTEIDSPGMNNSPVVRSSLDGSRRTTTSTAGVTAGNSTRTVTKRTHKHPHQSQQQQSQQQQQQQQSQQRTIHSSKKNSMDSLQSPRVIRSGTRAKTIHVPEQETIGNEVKEEQKPKLIENRNLQSSKSEKKTTIE